MLAYGKIPRTHKGCPAIAFFDQPSLRKVRKIPPDGSGAVMQLVYQFINRAEFARFYDLQHLPDPLLLLHIALLFVIIVAHFEKARSHLDFF